MKNMYKNYGFYIKTLLAYGMLVALLHCPSMQYEQKYDTNDQVGVAVEYAADGVPELEGNAVKSAYPYARMMNLIEQCRSFESKFHKYSVERNQDPDFGIKKIKELWGKVEKTSQRLHEEQQSFSSYISDSRLQNSGDEGETKVDYLCKSGKCAYTTSSEKVLLRKGRKAKTSRYISQVLEKNLDKMKLMSSRLSALIESARLEDEAIRALSASKAKEFKRPAGSESAGFDQPIDRFDFPTGAGGSASGFNPPNSDNEI